MANTKDRFSAIFGEGEDFWTAAPTLSDVVPTLVAQTGAGRLSSRELVQGRSAVTGGRAFRAAKTRSAQGVPGRMAPAPQAPSYQEPEYREPDQGRAGGRSDDYRAGRDDMYSAGEFTGGGFTSDPAFTGVGGGAVPDYVMGKIASGIAGQTATGLLGGMALGAKPAALLNPAIGSALRGTIGPGLANTIAGGIVSSEIGDYVGERERQADIEGFADVSQMGPGTEYDVARANALEAARAANLNMGGALGIGARQLASFFTDKVQSPVDLATSLERQSMAASEAMSPAVTPEEQLPGGTMGFGMQPQDLQITQTPGLLEQLSSALPSFQAPGSDAFTRAPIGAEVGLAALAKDSPQQQHIAQMEKQARIADLQQQIASIGSIRGGKGHAEQVAMKQRAMKAQLENQLAQELGIGTFAQQRTPWDRGGGDISGGMAGGQLGAGRTGGGDWGGASRGGFGGGTVGGL